MSVEWMMESRQAAMSKDNASSESDESMCRFESGGVKRLRGDVKSAGVGIAEIVPIGTSRLDNNAGTDFVV